MQMKMNFMQRKMTDKSELKHTFSWFIDDEMVGYFTEFCVCFLCARKQSYMSISSAARSVTWYGPVTIRCFCQPELETGDMHLMCF